MPRFPKKNNLGLRETILLQAPVGKKIETLTAAEIEPRLLSAKQAKNRRSLRSQRCVTTFVPHRIDETSGAGLKMFR